MTNNDRLARSYLMQAEEKIKHAKETFEGGNYAYVVRQCQEAVESLLKASLRLVGIEPPKFHDVGMVLKNEKDKFPEWFKNEIDELASIPRILRKERETSMYDYEETMASPELIYSRIDDENSLKMYLKVYELVKKYSKRNNKIAL